VNLKEKLRPALKAERGLETGSEIKTQFSCFIKTKKKKRR